MPAAQAQNQGEIPQADRVLSSEEPLAFQQPSVAMDPANSNRIAIAYHEGTQSQRCYLALSSDAGDTWDRRLLIAGGGEGEFGITKGIHCWNPVVAFGPEGTLYYAYQEAWGGEGGGDQSFITVSTDGGARFAMPRALDAGAESPNDWYPHLAVDQSTGRVYAAWGRYSLTGDGLPGRALVVSSTDRGRTFSDPVAINPPDQEATGAPWLTLGPPWLAVAPDSTLYAGYIDVTDAPEEGPIRGELYVASSKDEGQSFQLAPVGNVVAACETKNFSCEDLYPNGGARFHSIAAGTDRGQVYALWWGLDAQRQARVFFSASQDNGLGWNQPTILGSTATGEGHQQHRPGLAVAPKGTLYVAYYDLAPDGTQQVYLLSSDDGGQTFSDPQKFSSASFEFAAAPPGQMGVGHNFGDFLGLTATDSYVLAAWTDSRRGTSDTAKQDIFTRVEKTATKFRLWPILLVAIGLVALVGLALMVAALSARRRRTSTTPATERG